MEVTKPTVSDLVIMDIERDGTPPMPPSQEIAGLTKGLLTTIVL